MKEIAPKSSKSILPSFILGILIFLFCFSLFKNISYPLIWNDESFGAMVGDRILEYGYPKVHDGKNTVFMSLAADIKDENGKIVAYKEEQDAFIYETWGNYYWAAIGVFWGRFTDDIYQKTAFLRLPYAIIGFLGLIIFALSTRKLFSEPDPYKIFLILFIFAELFSISLVLHMREVRYYSLVIFVSSCFFYIYSNYFFYKNLTSLKYYLVMTLLLFFTYHINFIVCAILCVVLGFNRGVELLLEVAKSPGKFKDEFFTFFKSIIPVLIAVVLIFPFMIFFETFKTSAIISAYTKFTFETYQANFGMIYKYFTNLEFAYTFIVVKVFWFILRWNFLSDNAAKKNKKVETIMLMQKFSLLATSFLVLYALIIARTPYLFVRHYIVLQPVMMLVMIVDVFVIFYYIGLLKPSSVSMARSVCVVLLLISFSVNAKNKMEYVKGHIYELTHQYKGGLDYIIPYIKENFKNPDSLVIATNYEEFSYMYYLKSKVIIGYVYNNLEDDLKYTPDIILYRKAWGTDPKYFNEFMQKASYQKISFPVADYPVNNIPELDFIIKHLFKTKLAANENERLDMFVRSELIPNLKAPPMK